MKQISLFLLTLVFLASCSSDDYTEPQTSTKTQKVTFNVQSESFTLNSKPLKVSSKVIPSGYFLQCVFYKESGEVFLNKVYDNLKSIEDKGKAAVSIELPDGKYHVAFLSEIYSTDKPESYYINPQNYNTDYYLITSSRRTSMYNMGTYYETFDLVVKDGMAVQNIELKPMWSKIELEINNAKTLTVPDGTEAIIIEQEKVYDGFYLKSKLAKEGAPSSAFLFEALVSMADLRKQDVLKVTNTTTLNVDKNITLRVRYVKSDATVTLGSKTIKTFQPENGKAYSLSGALSNAGDSHPFNITFGELVPEVIPF